MSNAPKWGDCTTDELLAKVEAEHGPEAARVAYRLITGELPSRPARNASNIPHRVGEKARVWKGIGRAGRSGPSLREMGADPVGFADRYRGKRNASGLPSSGAPRARS